MLELIILTFFIAELIVCLSSGFSGIFEKTGLLNSIDSKLEKLSHVITKEGTFVVTSILTCMIACNQTLAILGVPVQSLLYAWYLYFLPVNLVISGIFSVVRKKKIIGMGMEHKKPML